MKCKVTSIKEQSYKGNKMYKFNLQDLEGKLQYVKFYEPGEIRRLRDTLGLGSVSELEGMIIEFKDKKAA